MAALEDTNVQVILRGLIKGVLVEYTEKIANLETKVQELETRLAAQELKTPQAVGQNMSGQPAADIANEGNRLNNLVIRGIAEGVNEQSIVTRLVNCELEVLMPPNEISATSRLGRIKPDVPRPLLVKFVNKQMRDAIYKSRGMLRVKGIDVFISEDLDLATATLAYNARQKAREKLIHRTWTEEGVVHIIRREGLAPSKIMTIEELTQVAATEQGSMTY